MLEFREISKEFDPGLSGVTAYRSMIKEYLQCKALEMIFRGPFQSRLVFIGGTRLRLINGFRRFSEDLDFDLRGDYKGEDHRDLMESLAAGFEKQNIKAEPDREKKVSAGTAFTGFLNFPGIMERMGIKDTPGRKFYIKFDAEKHNYGDYNYEPEVGILNHFDVFVPLRCAPLSFILSTKMCAILERAKGRDYYDIVELVKQTRPDISYIANRLEFGRMKTKYDGPDTYIKSALASLENVDWKEKTAEIKRFLFDPAEAEKVRLFAQYATDDRIRDWLRATGS